MGKSPNLYEQFLYMDLYVEYLMLVGIRIKLKFSFASLIYYRVVWWKYLPAWDIYLCSSYFDDSKIFSGLNISLSFLSCLSIADTNYKPSDTITIVLYFAKYSQGCKKRKKHPGIRDLEKYFMFKGYLFLIYHMILIIT